MTDDPGQDRRRALIQLDWKIYADMEYWPLSDAIKLVLGVSPEACDDDRSLIRSIDIKMKRLISRVYYANPDWQQPSDDPPLDEKKLNEWLKSQGFDAVKTVAQWPVEVNDRGEVNAKQFIAWALEDGVEVPLGLIELVNPELATASLTRNNELHGVITRTYDGLKNKLNPNPSNSEVWKNLMNVKYDHDEVIQNQDNDTIDWKSWLGNHQKMKRTTFNNFLSKLRSSKLRSTTN